MNRRERRATWLTQHRRGVRPPQPASGQIPGALSMRLQIDEVVLHGFPVTSRYSIGEAMQQHLTELIISRGMPSALTQSVDAAEIDAGSFLMHASTKPSTIGTMVANAVYGGAKQ